MSTPVLYFSNRCQFSLKLLDAIRSNEISTKNVCIDFADDIPNNIKSVPSIIYKNKIYVGKGSFDLIKSLIDAKKSQGANTGIQPMDCIGCDPYTYINDDQQPMEDYYSFISGTPTRADAYGPSASANDENVHPSMKTNKDSSTISKDNLNEKQFDISKLQQMRDSDSGCQIKRVNFQV